MNFEKYKIVDRTTELNGRQRIYRFKNNYGASLLEASFAYGGREIAVLEFPYSDSDNYKITYNTPITNDVCGYLKEEQVYQILEQIQKIGQIQKLKQSFWKRLKQLISRWFK